MCRYLAVSVKEKDQQQMSRVVPIPNRMGPLDMVEYYDGPMAKELKEQFLFAWIAGAGLSQNMSVASAVTFPGHEYFLLSRAVTFQDATSFHANWQPLILESTRAVTLGRRGVAR